MGEPTPLLSLGRSPDLLTVEAFARLAAAGERRTYAPGERLMKQGESADCLWVILSGSVNVVREHRDLATPILLATLGTGQVVGEMGLLDGEPRSATVTAVEPTVTMRVPSPTLSRVVEEHPGLYGALVKVLSKRLRDTNELAAQIASDGGKSAASPSTESSS